MKIYTLAETAELETKPEIIFWVGCAGSFDPRAQKITEALVKILNHTGIKYAVLGNEESCTGDPARRSGNEFVFQMMALQNIETLNMYGVKKIVTACPHCFNTIKNEYPALGGSYEVIHHTQLIAELIKEGKLKIEGGKFEGKTIAYHDSCYLGRVNNTYEAPREILNFLDNSWVEAKRNRTKGFCCGAGGAQVFKEEEKSTTDTKVNHARAEELLEASPDIIAANCPYCILMLNDGVKSKGKDEEVMIYDLSELIVTANDL